MTDADDDDDGGNRMELTPFAGSFACIAALLAAAASPAEQGESLAAAAALRALMCHDAEPRDCVDNVVAEGECWSSPAADRGGSRATRRRVRAKSPTSAGLFVVVVLVVVLVLVLVMMAVVGAQSEEDCMPGCNVGRVCPDVCCPGAPVVGPYGRGIDAAVAAKSRSIEGRC